MPSVVCFRVLERRLSVAWSAVSGLQDIDPGIFPFEIRPAASPRIGPLDGLPGFVEPARCEQSPCNLGGDLWGPPDRLLKLRDERIDIALRTSAWIRSSNWP
jgi:hypothetical protein